MKVIFKRDLAKVGRKNDIKNVSDGYALNFLIPNGYAVAATSESEQKLKREIAEQGAHKKVQAALLHKSLEQVSNASVVISAKANDKGHLFSSIHADDIAKELLSQAKIEITADLIKLENPIKEVGIHKISVVAHGEEVKLNLEVKKQDGN